MKERKFPHTYVIIFFLIVFAAILTWIVPGGEYVATSTEAGGKVVNGLEYSRVDSIPQTWQLFGAMFKGFEKQAGIIVFILMIGGAFWIMNETRAIDSGIYSFLRFSTRLERFRLIRSLGVNNIILTLIMLLFSLFGAIFGMSEETIAFIIIMVPLAISMGYDSITGVALCFVAAALGFAGAVLNPFTIGIAQGIAGLPLFSGLEYRLFCWLIINIAGFWYILRYAARIRKNPELSPVHQDDEQWRGKVSEEKEIEHAKVAPAAWISFSFLAAGLIIFSYLNLLTEIKVGDPGAGTGSSVTLPLVPVITLLFILFSILALRSSARLYNLVLLMFTIAYLIVGVMGYGWYIMEIATLFFVMGLFSGISMNYSPNKITRLFIAGASDILPAAFVVGLAGGIIIILEDGRVVATLLHSASNAMSDFGKVTTVGIMYVIQNLINIVIPSGSAKAALTMPIMAPFSDLIGLSRQATVMAFQFGDGFTNMITPTSGVLIGVLGVAKIPYQKWVKWVAPLIVILIIIGFMLLIPTVTMKLKGF